MGILVPLIIACIGGYIFYQTRFLSDVYGIRKEIRFQTLIILIYVIIGIILFGMEPNKGNNSEMKQICVIISIISSLILLSLITTSTLLYPLRLYKNYKLERSKINNNRIINRKQTQIDKNTSNTKKEFKIYSLEEIIANETGFRLFMQHLAAEFSTGNVIIQMSCLLFIIILCFFVFFWNVSVWFVCVMFEYYDRESLVSSRIGAN